MVTSTSAIVEITGYTMMSGSNPLLNDKMETPKVMGDIKIRDNPIVMTITAKIDRESIKVVPKVMVLRREVTNPKTMLLKSVNVIIELNKR